ncbi:DUF1868 domain-containing protein [Capilliphycus salinus ALCB114379]|uniref:DUF1868 domain-containing protein n=1 Tax=Capilliphycus salinus TaxID=2768948 RepID=UPI0039A69D63
MDDTYQVYVNRVARMTLPETYNSQLDHIQESPKYKPLPEGGRQAVRFPGYSIIAPPVPDDPDNGDFYANLQACQQQLGEKLDPQFWVPVPPDSLHLTLADLIWNDAYRDACQDPEFEQKLQAAIAESFSAFKGNLIDQPIRWQVFGMIVMTRAIAVCLVPRDQESYEEIVQFRRAIYQNPSFMALGIEQQYHFTAHITFGYFGTIPSDLDRNHLSGILSDFNSQWIDSPEELVIKRAELRKFDDMTRYYREENWPVLEF